MRLVKVRCPQGQGEEVARIAFDTGITKVAIHQVACYEKGKKPQMEDVLDMSMPSPRAKVFIETLTSSSIYDPKTFAFNIRHPMSMAGPMSPQDVSYPFANPTIDVALDLWQFSHITVSLIVRVLASGAILSYGLVEDKLMYILAGLLFMPYLPQILSMALGVVMRESKLFRQGLFAWAVCTVLIVVSAVAVGLAMDGPIRFDEFGDPLTGAVLSAVLGIAAGYAATDDTGRRELIGLAATAGTTIYPAWFGLSLVYGFHDHVDRIASFFLNVTILMVVAGVTFLVIGMCGEGVRKLMKGELGGDQG